MFLLIYELNPFLEIKYIIKNKLFGLKKNLIQVRFLFQKLGNGLRAAAKSQINLVMSEVPGVKQAEGILTSDRPKPIPKPKVSDH